MENQTKNIIAATGVGLAVGAALGILFAPAKGTKTRSKIKGQVKDLSNKVSDLKNSFASGELNPMEMLAGLKEHVESGLKDGKEEVKSELLDQIQKLEKALK
jgi:gas vesicle protein